MNIFVYSDESGVFDKAHNDLFVFGGVMFLSAEDKEICARKYAKAEKDIKEKMNLGKESEAKASLISNADKGKLYRSLNGQIRFAVVIEEKRVLDRIFKSKKDKQRYLDYAYKIAVKRCFQRLIEEGKIKPEEVERLHFYVDEHTTATNGKYELRESLEQEFKLGTYNWSFSTYFPPIFPNLKSVELDFCDSKRKYLVRAADIVANHVFHLARTDQKDKMEKENTYISYLP